MDDDTALVAAAELIDAGRPARALEQVARVLGHDPGNPTARLLEAMALEGTDPEAARARAEALVGDLPDWAEAWEQLTFILAEHFTPAETVEAAERALRLRPDSEKVQLCLSDVFMSHEDPQAALEAVDRALRINPGNWRAQARRGHCLLLTGHPAEGLAIARRVSGAHPDDPYCGRILAIMESTAGHHDAAIRLSRQAAQQAMGQQGTADTALKVLAAALNRMLALWCGIGPLMAGTWPLLRAWDPVREVPVAVLITLAVVAAQVFAWPLLCHGMSRRRILAVLRRSTTRMRLAMCAGFFYLVPVITALRFRYGWARHGIVPPLATAVLLLAAFASVGITARRTGSGQHRQPPGG